MFRFGIIQCVRPFVRLLSVTLTTERRVYFESELKEERERERGEKMFTVAPEERGDGDLKTVRG